jgi:tRNA pseudouridine55 synthase
MGDGKARLFAGGTGRVVHGRGTQEKGPGHFGLAGVDKPAGPDLDRRRQQGALGFRRQEGGPCRHAGPGRDGVLAVALGEATKTVPYVTDALKAYAFTCGWGQATNTDDAEGEVTATSA